MKYPTVIVTWRDAVADNGWEPESAVTGEAEIVTTVGYLIKETEDCFVVASSVSADESNARMTIPKAWTKELKYVKLIVE